MLYSILSLTLISGTLSNEICLIKKKGLTLDILTMELMSQLCYGPVVTYCMVYHYTKRAMLARLLANEGPAIYVVHLNRYFVIPP